MVKITFLGHDAFLLEEGAHRLVVDPFLTGNPIAKMKPQEIKVQYVLLTHGHSDHLGDGIAIARANNATIIAPNELAVYCGNKGCLNHPMHIGGAHPFPFGRVKLTIAHHGSAADLGGDALTYMGNPCGFLITLGGKTVYHAGDTGLFLDMQLIGEIDHIDAALLPIGDNFTMGIDDAVRAAEMLKPGLVIPMHYNTFGLIAADAGDFKKKAEAKGIRTAIMQVNESLNL